MTPSEKKIVRSLIAVAWADGKLESEESGVIEGLLCGLDASESEERELLEYAKRRRSIEEDIAVAELSRPERELLLTNAALLTHADGEQSATERAVLERLVAVLGFTRNDAESLLAGVVEAARRAAR